MYIWICDVKGDLIEAVNNLINYEDGNRGITLEVKPNRIMTYHGSILDKPVDAIVSPANSFGFMDGGIDALYTKFFGPQVQERVQQYLKDSYVGELLVGQALSVATDNPFIPYCISAPTMRIPQPITDPADVYLATRAAVRYAKLAQFRSISMPGMGTGYGNVSPMIAARAMYEAIHSVIDKPVEFPKNIHEAVYRHRELKG